MELLEQADRALFLFLNRLHHPLLNPVMYVFSAKLLLLPLYLVLLWMVWKYRGWRNLLLTLPAVALAILLADQGSVQLFKNIFQRYRPCHNTEIRDLVYTSGHCGGMYGFISSHAANAAAAGTLLLLILHKPFPKILWIILPWVFLVGYSRIYFGVHYPSDIFIGWIFGALCGMLTFFIWRMSASKWSGTHTKSESVP